MQIDKTARATRRQGSLGSDIAAQTLRRAGIPVCRLNPERAIAAA